MGGSLRDAACRRGGTAQGGGLLPQVNRFLLRPLKVPRFISAAAACPCAVL